METYSEKMLDAIMESDFVQSEINLEKAIRFDENEVLESLSDELLRMGFIDEAKRVLVFLLEKNPQHSFLHISLAEIAIEEDDLDAALDHLVKVKKSDPGYPASLLVAADLYLTIQAPETSEMKLKEAQSLLPNEPTIIFALAELYLEMERYSEAIVYYETLVKSGIEEFAQVSLFKQLAIAQSQLGEFDKGIKLLEKALETDRKDEVLHLLAILYIQVEERERAIALLEEVRLMSDTYLDVYIPLVSALIDEERLEEADEMIQLGLQENPYHLSLYHLASDFAFRYHKVEQAEEYLLKALQVEEDKELTLIKLSNLYLTQEKYEEVVELLEDEQELMHVQGHWSLAKAYYGLEEYEQSGAQYHKAYEGLHDEPEFLKEFGLFLREEGKIDEASVVLAEYLQYEPEDFEVHSLLEE